MWPCRGGSLGAVQGQDTDSYRPQSVSGAVGGSPRNTDVRCGMVHAGLGVVEGVDDVSCVPPTVEV